jgi:hypothetical protein
VAEAKSRGARGHRQHADAGHDGEHGQGAQQRADAGDGQGYFQSGLRVLGSVTLRCPRKG